MEFGCIGFIDKMVQEINKSIGVQIPGSLLLVPRFNHWFTANLQAESMSNDVFTLRKYLKKDFHGLQAFAL